MTTEERSSGQESSQANGFTSNAKDAKAQETENQDNAIEDDCIIGLDTIDVWEEDEKDKPRRRSWDRVRGKEKRSSREREKDRDRERDSNRNRRRSRSRGRRSRSRGRKSRSNGRRSRSNERRREPSRRDPNKSSKDIEQDKLRAKKDNDSKMLAEKEKAIKTLLDSDNVLPPGTETEAIQNIFDKNQQEQEIRNQEDRNRVSRDNRKRSPIHSRLGPKKLSKSPIRLSPLRRARSPYSPSRRRRSNDRDNSIERRIASRRRLRDRAGRRSRSRSRDRRRSRSRSYERRRSRSGGRRSRSPFERRLRRRTMSRSRSPDRARRRSPFINELARQFSHEAILPDNPIGPGPIPGYGAVPAMDPRMGPGILQTPGMPGPQMMNPMHPGVVHPAAPIMHSGQGMPGPRGPPFLGYDGPSGPFDQMNLGPAPVDFPNASLFMNPVPPHSLRPVSPVPQPVPAPIIGQGAYPPPIGAPLHHLAPNTMLGARDKYSPNASYGSRHSGSPNDKYRNKTLREERMKTPEPPIISDIKPNEKTSLSSLLEASVSSKDASSSSTPFRGFRPEIIRHCERALRSLPTEDPRLKMKGRFFFEPTKKEENKDKPSAGSNSILLRKGRTEIYWDEEEDQMSSAGQTQIVQSSQRLSTHQKYVQTDETTRESIGVQAEEEPKSTADFCQQVSPHDLMPPAEEPRRVPPPMAMEDNRRVPLIEDMRRSMDDNRRGMDDMRRPAMEDVTRRPVDRLDWSMKETYDYGADRLRETEDLRWNLNNSAAAAGVGVASGMGPSGNHIARPSDRLQWSRGFSPKQIDHMHGNAPMNKQMDNYMRNDRDMDMRLFDMLRERERLMGSDARGAAGLVNRSGNMLDDYTTRRPPIKDDFDMRKGFGAGSSSSGGPGSIGSFNRAMEMMEKERKEQFGDSPIPDDPDDELEIIEERGSWQSRTAATTAAQFGNPRGGGGGAGVAGATGNVNRSFRGRLGGYRNY